MHALSDRPLSSTEYRRGLFVLATALAASVFPLIWMGGLVTSHGVGMSVPDWPNSYGYNMVLFPPSKWIGGIFYEHTHRLLGTLSGFLAVWLALAAWGPARRPLVRRGLIGVSVLGWLVTFGAAVLAWLATRNGWYSESLRRALPHLPVGFGSLALVATIAACCRRSEGRRGVRWLTVVALVAVSTQGLLGGLRVDLVSRALAIVHGCFAQAVFALVTVQAVTLSRWWTTARVDRAHLGIGRRVVALTTLAVCVIYGQLIAGALMRHNGAGLAIPDLPLAYGHLLPPHDAAGLAAANNVRAWQDDPLPPTTLLQIWLHFAHRCGAILVTMAVLATAASIFKNAGLRRAAGGPAAILLALLATQVTLGILTVYLRKPADVASAHVAVGALTLVTAAVTAAVLARQFPRALTAGDAARASAERKTGASTAAEPVAELATV